MKKKSSVKIILKYLLLALILFLLLLIVRSANWFLANFGEVEFSTVLFQLFSPLEGTSEGVLSQYFHEVLFWAVSITFAVTAFFMFFDFVLQKLQFTWEFKLFSGKWSLGSNYRHFIIFRDVAMIIAVIALIILSVNRAIVIGIPQYVAQVMQRTKIYEEEYVNPHDVTLGFPDKKRNLILIYLESMETTYTSVENGGGKAEDLIPELTSLAQQNVNFSATDKLGGFECYKAGWTMGGLMSSSSGVPYTLPVGGNEMQYHTEFLPGLVTLGDVLNENGYHNYFLCGSEAIFAGRKQYYEQHGNYEIIDYTYALNNGWIPEDYKVFWGFEDQKLYKFAKDVLSSMPKDEPFNLSFLTVDTHAPDGYVCELCEDKYSEQYANVIGCASRQAYEFVKWCSEQDWYENTTIVLMGDHISMSTGFYDDIGDYERCVYNCFVNVPDGIDGSHSKGRNCTTYDMFPTIVASLGIEIDGNRLGLGTNLFSGDQTITERLGEDYFREELSKYSPYYFSNFVVN